MIAVDGEAASKLCDTLKAGLPQWLDPCSIGNNLMAELIWTAIAIMLAFFVSFYLLSSNRNARFRFFGLTRRHPSACIFVSNVFVQSASALEPVTNGYRGPAISQLEYEAAIQIQKKLTEKPIAVILEPLQNLIDKHICRYRDVEAEIRLSPRPLGNDPFTADLLERSVASNLVDGANIAIGSQIYNSVTKWYLEHHLPDPTQAYESWFSIARNERSERIIARVNNTGGNVELPRIIGDGQDSIEPAFVVRIHHRGKTVFLCAGIADWATAASVRYLVSQWKFLHRAMRDRDFGVALAFRRSEVSGTCNLTTSEPFGLKPSSKSAGSPSIR